MASKPVVKKPAVIKPKAPSSTAKKPTPSAPVRVNTSPVRPVTPVKTATNPSVKSTGSGSAPGTGVGTSKNIAGGYGATSYKPPTTTATKPTYSPTGVANNALNAGKQIAGGMKPQTTVQPQGTAVNIQMADGNYKQGQLINGKTYVNGKPITGNPAFEGAKVYTPSGGTWTVQGGYGYSDAEMAQANQNQMVPEEMTFGEMPDFQGAYDDVYGLMNQFQQQFQDLLAQQQKMSPEEYYKMAEARLRPMFEAGQGQLNQQLQELNRQAGLTAEARGLTGSELERVQQAGNLSQYSKSLADLQAQYAQGVQAGGGQDYQTAQSILNQMATQLGNTFNLSSGALNSLMGNYLDAWKGYQQNQQATAGLKLSEKELAQDTAYKQELLKDARKKQAFDEYVAKQELALKSRAMALQSQAQSQGPDAYAQTQNYVNFVNTVMPYIKSGDVSYAEALIKNNATLSFAQKSELMNLVGGAKGAISIGNPLGLQ